MVIPHNQIDELAALKPWTGAEPDTRDASCIELASGVFWLRMPIFMIPHINIWLLADGDGWTVVDTGTHNPAAIEAWEAVAGTLLQGKPIVRVVATHCHPDHCGMSGWLEERFGATLHMTRPEYQQALLSEMERPGCAPAQWLDFLRAHGWGDDDIAFYREEFGLFERVTRPMPVQFVRLQEGDELQIGEHKWRVVTGSGHSPEHACLYCDELNLLIAGDQVLPYISSNISVLPREPDANPLDNWFNSLDRIRRVIPADVTVLPAHGPLFQGLHVRIGEIIEDHEGRLDGIRAILAQQGARTTVELFPVLFKRAITPKNIRMATGETIAHCNYLVSRGEIARDICSDGLIRWRRTPDLAMS